MNLHQIQKNKRQKKAFTLVELIIVITILAILATIAFISFQNYYKTTRDSVRVSDIKIIYDGLSVYKIKTGKYPMPDAAVDISAGKNPLTHQGEVAKDLKQIISLNGNASDPKDKKNYIYAIDVRNQKGQLMTYLEEGNNIKYLTLFPQMYADTSTYNYTDRPVYIYGDTLGIITDENKVPIQYTTTNSGVNILDDEYSDLTTYIGGNVGDDGKITSTGNVLAGEIESSLSGTLSCGNTSYSGYLLTGLGHNESGNFTKENIISDGKQDLQLTVTCINGTYDTQNAIETITRVECTTSNYVPHGNLCVENKCADNIPNHAHSTATSQDHLKSWTYQAPGNICSFECDVNYTYDAGSNTCQADTKVESCGVIPNNSTYNSVSSITQTWNETVWLPSNTSVHNPLPSTTECRFECNAGYSYDSGSNTCIGNSCTIPATDTYNSKTYTIASPGTLVHNNTVTRVGTSLFGSIPSNGSITANFEYSCNAGVLSKVVTNTGGSCEPGYSFNNNYSTPACSAISYSVIFHSDGGSSVSNINTSYNTLITQPSNPTKLGYTFGGWYKEAGLTNLWVFGSDKVTSNITLYAKWTPITYTLTYSNNGGTLSGCSPTTYTIETPTFSPTCTTKTRAGYTFSSFNPASIALGSTGDKTITAQWTPNNNTITFNGNGNTGGSTTAQTLATAATAALTANGFTRTGYTFAGWATSAGGAVVYANSANYTMGTSDVTLYAKWTPITYTLTYSNNGGTLSGCSPTTYTIETATFSPTCTTKTRTGHVFSGFSPASIALGNTGDKTITAQWTASCPAGMTLVGAECRSSIRPKNTFYNAYYDCVNNFGTTLIGTNSYDSNIYWRSSSVGQVNYMCGSGSFSCYPDIFPPPNLSGQCKSATNTLNVIFQGHHNTQGCTPAYDGTAYYQCYKPL